MKKSHPLKGRKVPREIVARREATRKANREAKLAGKLNTTPEDRISDALVFLSHAHRILKVKVDLRNGELKAEALYVQLAIRTLRGDI